MLNKSLPWATIVVLAITLIYALVGGAVVIWGPPGALSFQQYGDELKGFAVAVGVLGIGRGLKAGLENHALLSSPLNGADLVPPDDGGVSEAAPEPSLGASHV